MQASSPEQSFKAKLHEMKMDAGKPHINDVVPHEEVQGNTRLLTFPDGSAIVGNAHDPRAKGQYKGHNQNLTEIIPDVDLAKIGYDLKQNIEDDLESQSQYFQSVAALIDLLGIKPSDDTERDDLPYDGAPTIKSMALFQTAMDIVATASASLYPSTGMVDTIIHGESNQFVRDRAWRMKAFYNYYLTDVALEFKKEAKRTLFWAALTGSNYKKVFIDPLLMRPVSLFIRPEDFVINRSHSTHLTARRKTHILRLSKNEFKMRQLKGFYRSDFSPLPTDTMRDENTEIQEQLNQIDGVSTDNAAEEEFYKIYECYDDLYIKADPEAPRFEFAIPYITSIDAETGRVLSIYRNWREQDNSYKRLEFFVNYSLFPSLDGEGYGLLNYASRAAEAATMMRRQLIQAASYASFPAGVIAQGVRLENNNINPKPGEWVSIMTGGVPMGDVLGPLPYKEPSPTLKELLDNIEDDIKKPSLIVNQAVAEMAPRAPMGSVLAILQNLQKVPNMLVQGFHESFKHELTLFKDRFYEWLPAGQPYPFMVPGGQAVIAKEDFSPNIVVEPASDPSMHNSSYRFMQAEIVLNHANQNPQLHNMYEVYQDFYKKLDVPPDEIEKFLVAPQQQPPPFTGDPVSENAYMLQGKPITTSLDQDHDAHMITHGAIINDPQSTPEQIAAAHAHVQKHRADKFLVEMQSKIGMQIPQDPSQVPPEIQNQIAVLSAQIVQQEAQAQGPATPPIDPNQVMLAQVQNEAALGKDKHDIERLRIALEEYKVQSENRLEELKLQQKAQNDTLRAELDNKKIELDHMMKQHAHAAKSTSHTPQPQS